MSGVMKVFFDRIIDWEFDDAPGRNPIIHGDVPPRPEPLPKFLDDEEMTAFMHHAETEPDPLRKLCVLLLARTGMRVGELCNLAADPVAEIGDHHSLHVPVGKLRNDRYIPLHPTLVELIADWQTNNAAHIARTGRLLTDDASAINRYRVARMVNRIAKNAGIGHVHPHQLRHTVATQAINRGMRLESVAALLGHKNLEMTMVYARIADATVAEEYFNVTNQVDQLYATATTGTRTMKLDPDTTTSIDLTRAEALVLHDWLSRHKHTGTTPGDHTEQTALNNLTAALDRTLVEPFQADYNEIVQAARTQLTNVSDPT
jgi:site-specific recombinase XerD